MDSNTDLEKLTAEYYASFPKKKDQLEEAFRLILQNDWDKKSLITLKFLTHKLSGSTGLYGFTKLSNAIQSMEKAIDRFKSRGGEKEVISKIFSEVIAQFDHEIVAREMQ
jgi:HPt (histidine-containing phosphotransfer) domain-containing protein